MKFLNSLLLSLTILFGSSALRAQDAPAVDNPEPEQLAEIFPLLYSPVISDLRVLSNPREHITKLDYNVAHPGHLYAYVETEAMPGEPPQNPGAWHTVAGLYKGFTPVAIKVDSSGDLVTGADPGGAVTSCTACIVVGGLSGFTPVALNVGSDGTVITSGGGGGGTVFPVTVSGTVNSGGIPCFTNATTESSSAAISAGVLIAGGGAGACAVASHVTDNSFTVTSTEPIIAPANTSLAFRFSNDAASGGFSSFSNGVILVQSGGGNSNEFSGNALGEFELAGTGALNWFPTTVGSVDTGLSRKAAGMVVVGNGTAGNTTGYIKSTQSLAVTGSDFTCSTGCTSLATITGLSATLPLVSANWSFSCHLIISQATAAATDQIGVQTATTASTNLAATAIAYTAAAVSTSGSLVGASSTSSQSVLTFTPGATGTNLPLILSGTVEGASASGTVLNIQILTGSSSDAITVKRGSTCWVY